MVGIVASKAAGIRLVWIVAVLLLPITILMFFLLQNLQSKQSTNEEELAGAKFIDLVAMVLLDAAEGKSKSENYDLLSRDGPAIAAAAHASGPFEPLQKLISLPIIQPISVMKVANDIIHSVAEDSGIILDSSPETYYLGVAAAVSMPDFVVSLKSLQLKQAIAIADPSNRNLAVVAAADGTQRENIRLLHSQVNAAKNVARSNYAYLPILSDFDLIEKENRNRTESIVYNFLLGEKSGNARLEGAAAVSKISFDTHRTLWKKLIEKFVDIKTAQIAELSKRISLVVLTSFASVLIGLGSAVAMFNSTLRRLDDISKAQVEANSARHEAEALANKLTGINDEMVGVNRELANQMHMLKEAQDALVSKGRMEQLGQLTATIAHELRNPLGAVRTSAFLIERKTKGKDYGFEAQLARINNGVSRCDDIITQLLDFSRTKPLASRPSDLDHWLAKMIEDEAKQLPAAVSIECDFNLQERQVPFDPSRLQRAMINLLSNACEALVGKGDDPSKFANVNPTICVSTNVQDRFVVLRVKDNGPGISVENLAKIREPLFTTKSFGTGLGLPAVEQIAHQHHGRLEVTSVLGNGAEFTLYLPLEIEQEKVA